MLLISFNFISDYLYDSHPVTQRPELSSRAQPGSRLGVYPGNTELRACSRSFTRRVAPKKDPQRATQQYGDSEDSEETISVLLVGFLKDIY